MQEIGAVREPALALGGVGEQHVLEPAERALAVDRDDQPLAQRLVDDRADELLHPAVLLARRRGLDAQEVADVLRDLLAVDRRLGVTRGDRQDPTGGEVEVAVGVGGVALDGDLEGVPVEIDANGTARSGVAQVDEPA